MGWTVVPDVELANILQTGIKFMNQSRASVRAEEPVNADASDTDRLRLVVIVPAYNEEEMITQTIVGLRHALQALPQIDGQICVIDDGSGDHTALMANKAGAHRVVVHKRNRGLGAAVRSGITAALEMNADIAIKFDADLQHDPADLLPLIDPILSGEADIVYGDRFDRIEYKMPFVRRTGNAFFTFLMRLLTGWPLRDSQPGIFAVNREYLNVCSFPGDYNYTQQILLDAFHKDMRFAHVSVRFRKRGTGKSFVTIKYLFFALAQILLLLISLRPMRIFVPIGSFFLSIAVFVFTFEICAYLFGHSGRPVQNVNLVLGTGLFGLQTVFFGLVSELIVQSNRAARSSEVVRRTSSAPNDCGLNEPARREWRRGG